MALDQSETCTEHEIHIGSTRKMVTKSENFWSKFRSNATYAGRCMVKIHGFSWFPNQIDSFHF